MKIEKLCLFCEHFYFNSGTPDWSEYTPGSEAEMGCEKGLVDINLESDNLAMYRKAILTANYCQQYEQINIEDDEGVD